MLGAAKDVSPAFKGSSFRIKLSFNSQPSSLGLVGLLEACAAMVHQGFSFRVIAPRLLLDPKISSLAVLASSTKSLCFSRSLQNPWPWDRCHSLTARLGARDTELRPWWTRRRCVPKPQG